MQEQGTDILSNPTLRRKIVEHYTTTFIENEEWFSNLKQVHAVESDRLYDHFKITGAIDSGVSMSARDYNQLQNNELILNPFHHFKALALSAIFILERYLKKTLDVLQEITNEIQK